MNKSKLYALNLKLEEALGRRDYRNAREICDLIYEDAFTGYLSLLDSRKRIKRTLSMLGREDSKLVEILDSIIKRREKTLKQLEEEGMMLVDAQLNQEDGGS